MERTKSSCIGEKKKTPKILCNYLQNHFSPFLKLTRILVQCVYFSTIQTDTFDQVPKNISMSADSLYICLNKA